jgi:NAD(P)-dependent dehydrogenase (short-subunit alcohol dehydrogenase family)
VSTPSAPTLESLEGAVCAVTGASSGLGRAIAAALLAEGARVVGFARRFDAPRLGALPAPGQLAEVNLDVRREQDVRARFEELGPIDVLVLCAGVAHFAPAERLDAGALRDMLEVHIVGSFLCAREALAAMRERRRGHIVSIDSVAATHTFPDASGYTAAKAGQRGLMRVLAEEARPCGVRISRIAPGAVDTPLWDTRPGFDRRAMMPASDVAALLVDIIRRPGLSVEEMLVIPPTGNL